jgi:hypothetical protein
VEDWARSVVCVVRRACPSRRSPAGWAWLGTRCARRWFAISRRRFSGCRGGSIVDLYEAQIRALLAEWPRMPGPVIAERIKWPHSMAPLRKRLAVIRPEYVGIDQVDRVSYEPGEIAQCDLWFPEDEVKIPVAPGQSRTKVPVLVITLGFSRFMTAVMIPSRQAGDILSGMWQLISGIGRAPKTLLWDRESAIGGTGRVSAPAFAGTLATQIRLAPRRDPEFKGHGRARQRVSGDLVPAPAPRADLVMYSPRQLAARRREQAAMYNRWVERQHAIAEHDRKIHRFLLGFGVTVGVGLLAVLAAAGWLVYRAIAHVNAGTVHAGLGLAALAMLATPVGGSGCVTIVKHWH